MTENYFREGLDVYYDEYFGIIKFICDEYMTICIRKFSESEKSRDVCIIVYPSEYDKIEIAKASIK